MELLKIPISQYNRYLHNYQSNVCHNKYNFVQENVSANSRVDEHSENKALIYKYSRN